uniref:PH domain-containing protein n=3 Tax=Mesocestoides corti TaxID=53468 RepID=A0A5K3F962_MESCO
MATGLNAGCCSISRPPLDFTYKPANHPDWSDKPGFWDPYAVIEICLPTITRSVYPATRTMQLEKPTFEHPCGQEIVDGEICWGIQMYTETWKYDECVERAVQRYICFPCRMELEECISLKPERALAVLLTYLRQRGPFLVWMYRGKETAHTIGRYLARTAIQNISQLPVLERSSVIALGRHLSHLLRIACGHRLINMPKIVSKVWGPIFIKVENDKDAFPQVNLTEEEKLGVAIEIFLRMLECVPWHTMTPFQKAAESIELENCRYFTTTNAQRDCCLHERFEPPTSSSDSLCESVGIKTTSSGCPMEGHYKDAKQRKPRECSCKKKYFECALPADNCDLTYGGRTRLPQQDRI